MTGAAAFLAVLILAKWCFTGSYAWLRYGYDGVRFLWSVDFPVCLLDWQLKEGERTDLESKRLDQKGAAHGD